jgi:hypothetical protein
MMDIIENNVIEKSETRRKTERIVIHDREQWGII